MGFNEPRHRVNDMTDLQQTAPPVKLNLINMANEINDYVNGYSSQHTELGIKELKKFEMYIRKSFIMYRVFTDVQAGKYVDDTGHTVDENWLKKVNATLVRDFRYIKQRDGIDTYEI
jgi:hypothetical protein